MAYADEKLFLWINGLAGKSALADRVAQWLVSDYLIPVSLALALIGLWFLGGDRLSRQRNQIGVFTSLGSMGFSSLTVLVINAVYFRDRPFVDHDVTLLFYQPTDSSFPSNAVAASFGLAAAVWGVNRRVGMILMAGAGLYGLARIYAGVHYPLDVLAGVLIGIVIAYLVLKLRSLLEPVPTWVIKAARLLCLA